MSGTYLTRAEWRGYGLRGFPEDAWAAEGELLHALPGAAVSLVSRQRFEDFDLSLHWRVPPGGNSGIFYKVIEDLEAPWQSGLEMQLLHNAGHPDGNTPETSCGALYGLQAPLGAPICPPGLFNVARISVRGSRIEHWLNGQRVVTCDIGSGDFRSRVARSKFRDLPRFAASACGHIALQHHGTEAWFRNIRIEIPPV